ncbi:MAG: bacillithiol biosynthesis cysteine-adding enzyme BshC [Chitinophagales bacterium]
MKVEKLPILDLDILSDLMQDYLQEKSKVKDLFDYTKDISSFKKIIDDRSKININRSLLVDELTKQYSDLPDTDFVLNQIESLSSENTFTVTTAHQLCLFTGPLYFIYKAVSVIKLSQLLSKEYKEYNFIPVFWLGSEDHDFEEVNHFNIYNKKIVWSSEQSGPVGMMKNTNINNIIKELAKILYGNKNTEFIKYLKSVFLESENYTKSFISFLHYLFGAHGLVVLEQNNKLYKSAFSEILQDEIFNNLTEKSIEKNNNYIERNYELQAHSRSINIFYMKAGLRERIVKVGEEYLVNNTEIKFSEKELLTELKKYPERFSPNVVLRPLYQEFILPNLAYIGGAGELAYWLQLRNSFHSQGRKMPMLLLRDMALIIDKKTGDNIKKTQLDKKSLFQNTDLLIRKLVIECSSKDLDLENEFNALNKIFNTIDKKAVEIDNSLEKHILAQKKKAYNMLKVIEQKMLRAEKKNQDILVQRITAIKSHLFPKNKLQERHDNFLPYYKKYGTDFIDMLIENFNPISNEMKFIFEDE